LILLLDTNVLSKIISGKPPGYRREVEESRKRSEKQFTSVIVVHELLYGVARSLNPDKALDRVTVTLSGLSGIADFTPRDAEIAASLRATLSGRGELIGPYDLFIAAQALRLEAVLVTNNTREYKRVPGLEVVDWNI